MVWKKVIDSKELIVFEKELKDRKLKIEARMNTNREWQVFKTSIKGDNASLISDYLIDNEKDAKRLISKLLRGQDPKAQTSNITLKRAFKEDLVEKWFFSVDNNKQSNFIVLKFSDEISADLVLHEKYRVFEKAIIEQLEERLGLKDIGDLIRYDIYYYKKKSSSSTEFSPEYSFMDIEFEF